MADKNTPRNLGLKVWIFIASLVIVIGGCGQPRTSDTNRSAIVVTSPISWFSDYKTASAEAAKTGKPLLVDVMTAWCSACKRLDETVFSRPEFTEASRNFVLLRVDAEKQPALKKKWDVTGYPTIVFFESDGKELRRVHGAVPYQIMLDEMTAAEKANRLSRSKRSI